MTTTTGSNSNHNNRPDGSVTNNNNNPSNRGTVVSAQSVSTSESMGSPSSRSEQTTTVATTSATDSAFIQLNNLDIQGDDAASQGPSGVKKKKRGQRATGPDKTGRGLRQFSMKVCEKVESKGRTTYNEVADELVAEFALPNNDGTPPDQQQYDEKNIRRRVYDALNVLMAMDIISKDKKEIQWRGLPRTSLSDIEELKAERLSLRNRIEKKTAYAQELEEQYVGLQNLIRRNEHLYSSGNAPSGGVALPFILVQTRPHATVEVEISEDMQLVHFDFNSTPFELHDDNFVLKTMKFCEQPPFNNGHNNNSQQTNILMLENNTEGISTDPVPPPQPADMYQSHPQLHAQPRVIPTPVNNNDAAQVASPPVSSVIDAGNFGVRQNMATLSFISLAPFHNRRNPMFYLHRHQQQRQLLFVSRLQKKNAFVCFACSSIKQTRVRKRVKSNEELRNEILEFVASAGLPPGHVPSMKELTARERVDLANVVRRRGYKFIRELLASSEDCNELTSPSGVSLEDSLTEGQDEEALESTEPPSSTEIYSAETVASVSLDQRADSFPEEVDVGKSNPEAEECGSVRQDESSLAAVSDLGDSSYSAEITESNLQIESVELSNVAETESSSSEASVSENHSLVLDDTSSSSEREADNVLVTEEDEEVNDVEEDSPLTYDHYTSQDLNHTEHVVESVATESLSGDKDWMLGLSSSTSSIEEKTTRFLQNGYLDTVEDDNESSPEETTKGGEYSHGGQRSVSVAPNGSALAYEEVTYATEANNSQRNRDQRYGNAELDKDSHDETMKRENQVEITRLRFMLRQKELELSRLKEQIEKEKLSLSVLQRKAETEIQKAQMLVSQKDVELQEAEESLSGLQEVEIEYCGDGNVVEVTGSFNGWEHRVGLELEASKSTGKQKCWSTLLWLYPGTYEIKFIVDGQWITDPQRDSVTRGHITNNILKVD
ncbi:hypothetical protein IGI04_042051 [Brassica rapa subsp. trilocularis]|uniref:AMP-activated protein kinase glycogen-binding domain-containing protein n=1 Tax=Brassica rapa subsp. trilocularis TaxID=1813537 RepID=A0ABQ7KVH7_BRACM|nr:hypothetical protein IGI04_042051 [Brassica rapa subsp. trilocularis]